LPWSQFNPEIPLFQRDPLSKAIAMSKHPVYWFPAKRYGWGWGLPLVWQGWVVILVFGGLLALGAAAWLPTRQTDAFFIYTSVLCIGLFAICLLKGEPTGWRWGGK
jgi:hypothetical protein